ncbi:hypothetical protein [Caviibacter abscessus]|uniref:hypothetical protein n=1 Tax=Caviibacter abscessus TaxID=1766719 RepID=UPI0008322192|nr:hypothetical protein [Caviibacter abscessus]
MINLINKIEKEKVIDLNKEIKNKAFTDDEIIVLSTYIFKNNISLTRESEEIPKSNAEIDEDLVQFFKSIRKGEHISDLDDPIYLEYINIGIVEAIRNIKSGYSIIELINDSYLYVATFISKYYEQLSKSYDKSMISEIFRIYLIINLLISQKNIEKDEFSEKMAILLYLKIKEELDEGNNLTDILKDKQIDESYYESLVDLYENIEIDDLEDITEYAQDIEDEYKTTYNTFLLTYIEENMLISYLGLEGKKYSEKEIDERFNLSFKQNYINILKKLSENI